ncbi:tail fiber protein [Halomonas sp. 11-S5]|uniref:phage tail protein n=1 Tax=Halomonas sp. 11-S5 TaxID=2994064 RepID=UPI00246887E9|nr:tail fiber protein [Halomonas sp. 11-S5]
MEPFIGQIQLFPYNFAPRGWVFCEGQELQIEQNTALFSLIGTTYGGDGRTTFALPDLKTNSLDRNLHYCIALQGIYPTRD